MSAAVRAAGLLAVLVLASPGATAADDKQIQAAIKKGAESLKATFGQGGAAGGGQANHGIGPACLAGLALLEAGVPANDPAVKSLTAAIRTAAYTQTATYQIALCLMYLDRFGDPNDVPLIQALAARLVVGQTSVGGWGYECVGAVSPADVQRLQAMKPGPAGKLHPDVAAYAQALAAAKNAGGGDDNSNTQFGVLAVWMARKHGVPVDAALDKIERRFLATQNGRTGGWPYSGPVQGGGGGDGHGSPSMYCAGLLGLATGIARREEKRAAEAPKKEPGKGEAEPKKSPDDPFFNPAEPKKAEPKKSAARPLDARDRAVQFALAGLGMHLLESARAGRGALFLKADGGAHGEHDLYFFWSLERVGVIFGIEKIGDVDWYEAGAHTLVATQKPDGSWGGGAGFGAEVGTSFAVLFLCRSNLARDLSGKVQNETATEMRVVPLPGGNDPKPTIDPSTAAASATAPGGAPAAPAPAGSEAGTLAGELLRAADKDKEWAAALGKLRDTRGAVHTQALLTAVNRLDGDRRKAARDALADRLARMSADTLRAMAKYDDPELRRAAVLAMAMRDDKAHVPDLVDTISDDEELVIRAAVAGLKSLTGEDFGPRPNAAAGDKTLATGKWREWLAKQKK